MPPLCETEQRWATLKEAARYTRLSVSALRRLIAAKKIKASRPTDHVIVDLRELDKFLEQSADN
jgi:excisionase family DNA binding protein